MAIKIIQNMSTATISTHNGSVLSQAHNMRIPSLAKKEAHIDPNRPHESWVNKSLAEVYEREFGASVRAYNARQKRNDRKIENYLEKIKSDKSKHACYEMIVGVYHQSGQELTEQECKSILKEYAEGWQKRNPNLALVGVYYHADEQGKQPHLHIDYVPVAHGYKRGMDIQNSLSKALREQGFDTTVKHAHGKPSITPQIAWEKAENQTLEDICLWHGITVKHPQQGKNIKHLHTEIYKATKELEGVQEAFNASLKRLKDIEVKLSTLRDKKNEYEANIASQGCILKEQQQQLKRIKECIAEVIREATQGIDNAVEIGKTELIEQVRERAEKEIEMLQDEFEIEL